MRVSVATDLLDPTFDGRGVRWLRDEGGVEETFVRDDEGTIVSEDFPQSPFGFLLRSGQPTLRRRLDATYRRGEFQMLDKFQDQGATDYVAFSVRVGETIRLGVGEGITASWTTDAPERLHRRASRIARRDHAAADASHSCCGRPIATRARC